MLVTLKWRNAIIVSLFLHIFLLPVLGHLTASLTAPLPKTDEILLEMDLSSESPLPLDTVQNEKSPEEIPMKNQLSPPLTHSSTSTQPINSASAPQITTSPLSMTAAETLASASDYQPSTEGQPSAGASSTQGSTFSRPPLSGIAKPNILTKVNPVYPPAARQANLEGTVVLKIQILSSGRPGEIYVARSSGYPSLDEAAIEAVRQWQFVPAKDLNSGQPIVCTISQPISFQLHQ